jgi:uroporphyrin-III C-methyltransferase / precorrin-2 dehydrogenase / sirohydrochlorin ferrochelatase
MPPDHEPLYPVFLKLAGLLEAGARVTVIAPAISDAIRARAHAAPSAHGTAQRPGTAPRDAARLAIVERGFTPADLDGARWVVAAATPEVNREVAAAATARGLFVNAVDDVASASAYLGAVIRRGPAVLAISTGGLAPALAGLLREALEAVLPDDLARWIDVARAARADWKRAGIPITERRPLLLRALDRIYHSHEHGHEQARLVHASAGAPDPARDPAASRSRDEASRRPPGDAPAEPTGALS